MHWTRDSASVLFEHHRPAPVIRIVRPLTRMSKTTFTCGSCGRNWPENYCPECAHTIERATAPCHITLRIYKTHGWLWFGTSLTVFVMMGLLWRADEWKGNPSSSLAWAVYHGFAQMLSGREEFWGGPVWWLSGWTVIAVLVGWLLHSLIIMSIVSKR